MNRTTIRHDGLPVVGDSREELEVFVGGERSKRRGDFLNNLVDRNRFVNELRLPRLNLGEVEDVVDE